MKAGWTYLLNAAKWHYFNEDGRSLCKRWMVLSHRTDTQDTVPSKALGCKTCRKALDKLAAKTKTNPSSIPE